MLEDSRGDRLALLPMLCAGGKLGFYRMANALDHLIIEHRAQNSKTQTQKLVLFARNYSCVAQEGVKRKINTLSLNHIRFCLIADEVEKDLWRPR
jgi:hypothetical protein